MSGIGEVGTTLIVPVL
ncbi:hypothetical protein A2U01_0105558, partial [Trifolium medium]|nr:hypothetical protein [Trifolium medium]